MHDTTTSSSLAGKTIIVTGGAHGLGAAISTECVHQGASVVLVDRDSDQLVAHAAYLGGGASWVSADLSKADAPASIIADTILRFGSVDGVVHCADTSFFSSIEKTRPADIDQILAQHVRAPLLLIRAASSALSAGGSITTISSAMSTTEQRATALYSAAQGGLEAATVALAAELNSRRIRVNAVRHGLIRETVDERLAQNNSTWTSEDVASTVLFLLSDEASSITGQLIALDDGPSAANLSPRGEHA